MSSLREGFPADKQSSTLAYDYDSDSDLEEEATSSETDEDPLNEQENVLALNDTKDNRVSHRTHHVASRVSRLFCQYIGTVTRVRCDLHN